MLLFRIGFYSFRLRMKATSVCFLIVFVVLAASIPVTTMLMNYFQLFPNSSNISENLEIMSSTRRSISATETHVYNPYVKPLAGKSHFSEPKLNMNDNTDYKTILWWNPPDWAVLEQRRPDFTKCNYKNCKFSFDKKDVHKSNAIVFRLYGKEFGHTPPVSVDKRNPDQVWIFYTLEPVIFTQMPSPHWQNAFNWSWSYRLDSDIFHPYGGLKVRKNLPVRSYSEIFRKKTKQVAWLVSHCHTESRREDYVRILKKYIPVDIYGRCGEKPPDNVAEFINKNYKFYLGFENSLCPNYVTEKFFRYYRWDVINVVRGKTNYSAYFPAHSYINTADFSSIKALGEFLQALSKDEKEYIKYMKVKNMYEYTGIENEVACNVCDKINNMEKNRKTYKNVGEWFGECDRAKDLNES